MKACRPSIYGDFSEATAERLLAVSYQPSALQCPECPFEEAYGKFDEFREHLQKHSPDESLLPDERKKNHIRKNPVTSK